MNEVPGNTQAQPEASPPSTGINVEELQAKVAELERQKDEAIRQSEGRLRDLQSERSKRQELEQRVSPPASSAANNDVNGDELRKVLNPYISPLEQEIAQLRIEKTQKFLEDKTGKKWDDIEADKTFQDKLVNVVKKYGIGGNVYEKTVRAYDLLKLEEMKERDAERARAQAAAASSTLPSGAPPAPAAASKEYTAEEMKRLPLDMDKRGTWKKVGDKFVYTPHS